MVVLAATTIDRIPLLPAAQPDGGDGDASIPTIDLSCPSSAQALARACAGLGFAKLTGHGVSPELRDRLEVEAVRFFALPQLEKDRFGPAEPFGYGNKRIGCNGDFGWLEYLLFAVDGADLSSCSAAMPFLTDSPSFRAALNEYAAAMRRLAVTLLEKITEGLDVEATDALSRMVAGEGSEQLLRLNRYPPCPELPALSGGVTGFGEHTDPQLLSILRSVGAPGLQIAMPDGRWATVPNDRDAFFVSVGDCLQALTNGRLRSVRHRVVVAGSSIKSRLSMVFFAGPRAAQRIAPLPELMEEGERRMYREFTWVEYKRAAYRSRLADDRLSLFEERGRRSTTE